MRSHEHTNSGIWTIVGGGSGGLAVCAALGMQGLTARLLTTSDETADAVTRQGGVAVRGAMEGLGPVSLATTDAKDALTDASIVMIVLPSPYHEQTFARIAPYLEPGQILVLHPGMTLGALACQRALKRLGVDVSSLTIAETQTLLYACRKEGAASVVIHGIKRAVPLAALPTQATNVVLQALHPAFGQFTKAENTLVTGLGNINAIIHPAPTLLNITRLEGSVPWTYFHDGMTPSIGRFLERMDAQRITIGASFGTELPSISEIYRSLYGSSEESLLAILQGIEAYRKFPGPLGIGTRYLLEDIPYGLVPMSSLAQSAGIPCDCIEATINLASLLLGSDFSKTGRTLGSLGLEGLSCSQIREVCTYGSNV